MQFADLARLNGAFIESRTLQTAVLLGIFDVLDDGPASAAGVAERLGFDPRPTGLLLNVLERCSPEGEPLSKITCWTRP